MAPFFPLLHERDAELHDAPPPAPVSQDSALVAPAASTPAATAALAAAFTPALLACAAKRPGARSLLHPRFEHDSCGVGFVATTRGAANHDILEKALTALARLAHRGAVAADGLSSDGVGLMTAVPRELLLRETGVSLRPEQKLGLGVLFLPEGETRAEAALERALATEGFRALCWRDVPVRTEVLGESARGTMPTIRQVLVAEAAGEPYSREAEGLMERRLYLARKAFERAVEADEAAGYVCSLSAEVAVYKAMCLGRLLPEFFPDLTDPGYLTRFAIFHQRFATNTTPAWHRAQPGRKLAHNGEINTVWGNRARMDAREATLPAECKPILTADGTDSTSLDEALELISQNGRTLAESVRMLLPPATADRVSPFLRYHADCSEPWDGPAAIAFSDGHVVGAALDRNGLRPSRYARTEDGLVVAGSEAGLVDLDPEQVVESGRLGPGQILMVDLDAGRLLHNEELLDMFDASATYATLLEDAPLLPEPWPGTPEPGEAAAAQRGFGYTKEDVNLILKPMAVTGKDAVWSMGDDTPLAFLARSPRPLYHYFRQRFAQVTNPAIDPLREAVVVSLHTRLGPWPHLLDTHAPLPGISLPSPFLSLGQTAALRAGKYPHADTLRFAEIACLFPPEKSLEEAVEALCQRARAVVAGGTELLLLTDRGASATALPIPMAIAVGAVNAALTVAGLRTRCGLAVEAGDCRDLHHAAVLIGYGAGAVCPWLMFQTAQTLQPEGADGEAMTLRALEGGLAKVMSKMGISVVDSYRSAHLFDILGLHESVVERCFSGTPAPLSGIGFAEIERRVRLGWEAEGAGVAGGATAAAEAVAAGLGAVTQKIDLPDFGWVRFRKSDASEPHQWQPPTVKALQTTVGSARNVASAPDPAAQFAIFSRDADAGAGEPVRLRDLLEIRPAAAELQVVEPADSLVKRFVASAMSLGSLSPEAHQTVTAAMNSMGARSNTGEGGEDPAVYRPAGVPAPDSGGGEPTLRLAKDGAPNAVGGTAVAERVSAPAVHTSLNNKIKQVASGRFGVTAEYLAHAEEIEIKVAQGAKPGEGGQLPGHKVNGADRAAAACATGGESDFAAAAS